MHVHLLCSPLLYSVSCARIIQLQMTQSRDKRVWNIVALGMLLSRCVRTELQKPLRSKTYLSSCHLSSTLSFEIWPISHQPRRSCLHLDCTTQLSTTTSLAINSPSPSRATNPTPSPSTNSHHSQRCGLLLPPLLPSLRVPIIPSL